ncbi:MAG: hypothetical protein ACKVVT_17255 [Dehalococcoidia bacterium]
MGTARAVMAVLTHPRHPLQEDEYNEWYSFNHIQDVLLTPNFPSATRYRQTKAVVGSLAPYLALYQVENGDVEAAQEDFARQLMNPCAWRKPSGSPLVVDWWAYYRKLAETGAPTPEAPGWGALVTFAHPYSIFATKAVEAWHRDFLADMAECPRVRGSTLYKLALIAGGPSTGMPDLGVRQQAPPAYLTVHELVGAKGETADAINAEIVAWMRAGGGGRAATAAASEPGGPVALDFWGYYETVVSHRTSSLEELMRGGQ